jgi:hypothetical protein
MYRRLLPLLPVLAAAACAPENAKMTSGGYTAFLAASTSTSITKGSIDVDPADDKIQGDWKSSFNIDCRPPAPSTSFENAAEESALRLQNSVLDADGCSKLYNLGDSVNAGAETLQETWLAQDGYYVVQEDWDPWRGEGVITSEGDLQIGFHQRIPGGEDFRFEFVIDPDFQPQTCDADPETGKTTAVELDGDWLEQWSTNLTTLPADHPKTANYDVFKDYPGGTLYFPNAGSYQFNPDDPNTFDNPFWTLPNEWLDGISIGKYSEEYFQYRTIRYGEPDMYSVYEATNDQTDPIVAVQNVWYCDMAEDSDPTDSGSATCQNTVSASNWFNYPDLVKHANDVADETEMEMDAINDAAGDIGLSFRPIVEDNSWRTPDGQPPGLDGWAGLDYSWVVIAKDSDMTPGGHVSGAFQFVMDGSTSTSHYFMNGTFEVDHIRNDHWVNNNIQAIDLNGGASVNCFDKR